MSKKNVSNVGVSVVKGRSANLPERVSMDVIAVMTDDELMVSFRTFDEAREKATARGVDATPWEEEIAYLRREQQVRRLRRDLHDQWCHDVEREMAREEAMLPVADLDNSSFMFAAGR